MEKLHIICVDDQRQILASLEKDLTAVFDSHCILSLCESAQEARELIEEIYEDGEPLAVLICDHVMPGQSGIDFMTDLAKDTRFANLRKLLVTGMATHQDTINAINRANIDRYVEKPWDKVQLHGMVKTLLTHFVLQTGLDYQEYLPILDQDTLYKKLSWNT